MLGSINLLPRLSPRLSIRDGYEINHIQHPHHRSVPIGKVIDRIWNSMEMKVGATQTSLLLQTTVDELANLLHLERCSFLWYFPNTQRVQLVCQRVSGTQTPMPLGYYAPETFGLSSSAIERGQAVIVNSEPIHQKLSIISQLFSRFQKRSQQPKGLETREEFANLLVPLFRGKPDVLIQEESCIGLIACWRDRQKQWSPTEIEWLKLIAQQLEIAIGQTQLYQQSQNQAQKERLINQITSQTRQSLDLETILNSAIAQLLDALQIDRCLVHLVEEIREQEKGKASSVEKDGNQLTQKSLAPNSKSIGFWEAAHRAAYRRRHLYEVCRQPFPASIDDFDTQGPITQWVIQNRQMVVISDVNKDPRIGEQNEEYQKASIKSSLVIPVQANNVLHAILYLNQCSQNRHWSKSDLELAEAVGNQLAIAIQQACLFAQTRASIEQLAMLRLISDRVRSTLDLKTILQTAVREVRTILNTDRAAIYQFLDKSTGKIVVEEAKGKCLSFCSQMNESNCVLNQYTYSYSNLGEGIQAIDDVSNAPSDEDYIKYLQQLQVQASLVVPIVENKETAETEVNEKAEEKGILLTQNSSNTQSSVWGLLIVHECDRPRIWEQSEIELVEQLATQVSLAIQQAQLYEHARTSAQTAQNKAEALEKALYDLQQTQAQLIQTEKMSSLGQLVAGVAHEINNPVNFIYGNLSFANNYTQDLLKLVTLYQKHYPKSMPEIEACANAIDLEFIIEDLPKILSSMEVGADRIRQIVLSLRNFSRLDQAEMKPIDIHEGINNTLLILQNRLKANAGRPQIEIIKEYGNLPLVECYAGQLNQVFMNLLCNAIDALEEAMKDAERQNDSGQESSPPICPKIWIRTAEIDSDKISIGFIDNGLGIPPKVKSRLFDAFFTTKPVGQGTGLGLSISYQIIVEKHKGAIRCDSELGKGTEFWIQIPSRQS